MSPRSELERKLVIQPTCDLFLGASSKGGALEAHHLGRKGLFRFPGAWPCGFMQ